MKDMLKYGESMLAKNNEERKDYFEKYRNWKTELEIEKNNSPTKEPKESDQERICPRCGGRLVMRTASKGDHAGEQFWGCEAYPKCRYHEYV